MESDVKGYKISILQDKISSGDLLYKIMPIANNIFYYINFFRFFQVVKNLPTMQVTQEMWVHLLGQEDPLK